MSETDTIADTAPDAPRKPRGFGRKLAGFGVGLIVCVGLLTLIGLYSAPDTGTAETRSADTTAQGTPSSPDVTAQVSPSVSAQAPEPKPAPQADTTRIIAAEPDTSKVDPIVLADKITAPAPAPEPLAEAEADPAAAPVLKKSVFNTAPKLDPKPAPELAPVSKPLITFKATPDTTDTTDTAKVAPNLDQAPVALLKPVENLKPVEKLKSDEMLPAQPIKTAEILLPTPEPLTASPAVEEKPVQPSATLPITKDVALAPTSRKTRLPVVSDAAASTKNSFFGKRASSLPKVTAIGVSAPLIPQDQLNGQAGPAIAKRLKVPQSDTAPAQEAGPDTGADKTLASVDIAPAPVLRAIDKNAIGYDVGAKPLMSIILIDVGNSGAPLNSVATLELPLTFAVPVDRSDAALAAQRYSENGHEVLALSPRSVQMSLSGGQSQEQVSKLLSDFFDILPKSVGLLDVSEATLQNDRVLSKYVMRSLSESGHGLVTYDQGLNVAKREADKIGVPASLVFRVLDQKGEADKSIQRHLDRAAAEAQQQGHVLVIGTTRERTIQAVLKWSQGRAAQSVAIAPVSATMKSGG